MSDREQRATEIQKEIEAMRSVCSDLYRQQDRIQEDITRLEIELQNVEAGEELREYDVTKSINVVHLDTVGVLAADKDEALKLAKAWWSEEIVDVGISDLARRIVAEDSDAYEDNGSEKIEVKGPEDEDDEG